MENTTVSRLAPRERDELQAILKAHARGRAGDPVLVERFKSTFQDAFAGWIFLLLGSVGGAIACLANYTDIVRAAHRLPWMLHHLPDGLFDLARQFPLWGLPACVIVLLWTAVVVARNYHRRGYAATSFGFVRVRGGTLAMVRHTDVVAIKVHHAGSRGKTFAVLDLKPAEGKPLRLYPSARWVDVAIDLMARARAAARLPAITPEVTWGPYYREISIPQSSPSTTTTRTTTTPSK